MKTQHLDDITITFSNPSFLREETTIKILGHYENVLIGLVSAYTEQNVPYKFLVKWSKTHGSVIFCEKREFWEDMNLIDLKITKKDK